MYGIRYLMIIYAASIIMTEYTISYREMCYLMKRPGIQFSVLYRPNSWQQLPNKALNIYSSCLCSIHYITITKQKNLLRVIQFQFLYVPVSTLYSIQSITVPQQNRQPAIRAHAPRWTFGVENACNA